VEQASGPAERVTNYELRIANSYSSRDEVARNSNFAESNSRFAIRNGRAGGNLQRAVHPEIGEVEADRKRKTGPATGDSISDSIQNGPMQARRPALQRPRVHWCKEHQSGLWIEQPPRHGTDLIEGLEGPAAVPERCR